MFKLIGALCITGSCCAFAAQHILTKRKALGAVRSLRDLFREMERMITFQLIPLPDIIHQLLQGGQTSALLFLQPLELALTGDGPLSLSEAWPIALKAFRDETGLPEKAYAIAAALGQKLGQMDCETERERLLLAASDLNELLTALETEAEKTEKITQSLGILLGIGIVILLL